MDSRLRGNDRKAFNFVIPAKAGIQAVPDLLRNCLHAYKPFAGNLSINALAAAWESDIQATRVCNFTAHSHFQQSRFASSW